MPADGPRLLTPPARSYRDWHDPRADDSRARVLLRCHRIALDFGPLAAARALAWYDAQDASSASQPTPPA